MPIIIKTNQLNTIVYKYLLEAGLSHTAYSMFNQANLQDCLKQFKFDVKSGHLISLLQRALVFNQIQSHSNFDEFMDCQQPFYLLTPHVCKITEKVKVQKQDLMKQLNNNLVESVKRTNNIYNTQLSNKQYDDIIYQPKGTVYFDNFHSITNDDKQSFQTTILNGFNPANLGIYNKKQNIIYVTQTNSQTYSTQISKVYLFDNQISETQALKCFCLSPSHLLSVWNNGVVKVNQRCDEQKEFQFQLQFGKEIQKVIFNHQFPQLITLSNQNQFKIVNLSNQKIIMQQSGIMVWRAYDQYIKCSGVQIQLKSILKNEENLIKYMNSEFIFNQIKISDDKTYFAAISKMHINVYTFQNKEPLYQFNYSNSQEELLNVIWISRNQVQFLVLLTNQNILVWEVQLNSFCCKIQTKKFSPSGFKDILAINSEDGETFLLSLSDNTLLVTDIGNQKNQRIEVPGVSQFFKNIGPSQVLLKIQENLYFINSKVLKPIFK